ncbi:MAG TPA: MFS transporter [Kofleriaceae bacterium]|nr:MFS transporter [Kofleriaceae bacterium]
MIKNRTAILALLTALNFLNYMDRTVLAAVLKDIEGDLSLSKLQAGLLATAFLVGYFVTSPIFGARADKGTRKGLITIGVAVWSLATAASGLATSFATLLIARAVVGVGEAAYATLAPTIIDDITPPDRKNRALAIFYLAIPLGSAIGYPLGGIMAKHLGWRNAFYIAGGPGLAIALSCLLIAEPSRKLAGAKARIRDSLRTLARIPLYRRAVLGYCAWTWGAGAFQIWGPQFLQDRFSLDEAAAGTYFGAVLVVAGAIGTIVGGRWADRTQRALPPADPTAPYDGRRNREGINPLLRVCALGMVAAAPLGVACFVMPNAASFFGFAFLCSIGLFLSTSPVNAIGLRAVPPELRASAMAAMIFAIHLLGDLWSPPTVGLLQDHLPVTLAMMAVPLAFALSAYLWWPRAHEAE